ncbi:MAG: biotin--[acetyl-CoA-carboxylase] ligase [Leptospirillia bacterium]
MDHRPALETLRLRRIQNDPPGFFARELPSTNETLKSLILASEPDPLTFLLCGRQTRGRGRPGNVWSSVRGDLAMSLWIPQKDLGGDLPLSLYVAGACLEALPEIPGVRWKYPNDLCRKFSTGLDPDGESSVGKLGGILVEPLRQDGVLRGHVAGIGINLAGDRPPVPLADGALPIVTLAPTSLTPLSLSRRIVIALRALLARGDDPLRMCLDRHLLWRGRWVAYTQEGEDGGAPRSCLGRVAGLSKEGWLKVVDPDGCPCLLPPHVRTVRLLERSGGKDV